MNCKNCRWWADKEVPRSRLESGRDTSVLRAECRRHPNYQDRAASDWCGEYEKKIFNPENGIKYTCDNVVYYYHDGGFHYKIDRIKYREETNLDLEYIPEWGSVCNYKREKYIKENCSPDFKEKK